MRRQIVAKISAACAAPPAGLCGSLPKLGHFAHQEVNLLLLPHNDLVELIDQVFGKAGLYFQVCQALLDVLAPPEVVLLMFHDRIGP